jgi:ribosomal protein S18 acetylase RimI-like enzyme
MQRPEEGASRMADVSITRPSEADLPAVSALAWPDPDEARTRQIRLRNWYDLGNLIVVKFGEAVIAFAVIDRSFFDNGFVKLVVVAEQHRRRGIATMLLRTLRDRIDTEKLFTSTNESNYAMRLLLDSLGWQNMGTVRGLDDDDPELFYLAPAAKRASGATGARSAA